MNWHLETLNGIHFTSPADNQNHRDAKESETEESASQPATRNGKKRKKST